MYPTARPDPELLVLAQAGAMPALNLETLAQVRIRAVRPVKCLPPALCLSIPAADGHPVPLRIHGRRQLQKRRAAILHFHGGGFVLGNAAMMDKVNARRALAHRCLVVSVDYRLAPEAPFPAQLKDAYASLCWLAGAADELGIDARRITVTGESAGAGLAAALALYARDQGGPALAHQHLMYPMLDDRTGGRGDKLGTYIWTGDDNRYAWSALLGEAVHDSPSIYAAPTRASNLVGLPPTYIAVGALDLFLPECLDYAARLSEQGVPVEAHVYPGMIHAGEIFAPHAEISKRMQTDSRLALRRALALPTSLEQAAG